MQDSLFCSGLEDHSGRSGNSLHLSLISSFQISGPTLIIWIVCSNARENSGSLYLVTDYFSLFTANESNHR